MSKHTTNHIATGASGEEEAARYLKKLGFRRLASNWRPAARQGRLELDLVGRWEGVLVFAEVKTRRAASLDSCDAPPGLHGFTREKQRNMTRAARAYLAEHGAWEEPCRFDLVCVTFTADGKTHVEHYRNVIELGQTLDSGDASWQPW